MNPNEERDLVNLIVLPIAIGDRENKSGIDASVLSYIKENVSPDVARETPANYPPSAKNDFKDYYSGAEGKTQLTDEQKAQMAQVAVQGTALLISKLGEKKKNEYKQALLANCGRKPLIGRKKRQAYFECVANYNKKVAEAERIANMPTASASNVKEDKDWYKNPIVIVGGLTGLTLLGIFAFKAIKAKKA